MRGIANPLSLNKARTGSNPVPSALEILSEELEFLMSIHSFSEGGLHILERSHSWSSAAVLKTAKGASSSRVRISPSPQKISNVTILELRRLKTPARR
jgi:hypothetical protein